MIFDLPPELQDDEPSFCVQLALSRMTAEQRAEFEPRLRARRKRRRELHQEASRNYTAFKQDSHERPGSIKAKFQRGFKRKELLLELEDQKNKSLNLDCPEIEEVRLEIEAEDKLENERLKNEIATLGRLIEGFRILGLGVQIDFITGIIQQVKALNTQLESIKLPTEKDLPIPDFKQLLENQMNVLVGQLEFELSNFGSTPLAFAQTITGQRII
jgi:hypothetical protein